MDPEEDNDQNQNDQQMDENQSPPLDEQQMDDMNGQLPDGNQNYGIDPNQ